MKKHNVIIDVDKCHNCRNCFLATKDEHVGNSFLPYCDEQPLHGHSWIDIKYTERGTYPIVDGKYYPVMCNHCDNAPCIKAAKNNAITKRDDGIVIIDPIKSKGQQQIVKSCPYGAIYWNEEKDIPQAWIFDAHLLDQGWTQTRAEQVCPTGAFKTLCVEDDEMGRIVREEKLEVIDTKFASTKPRVYYKNLHYLNKLFVSGTVVKCEQGIETCIKGAKVSVLVNDQCHETVTDAFGEFKVDHLTPAQSGVEVKVYYNGDVKTVSIDELSQSAYVGVIDVLSEELVAV